MHVRLNGIKCVYSLSRQLAQLAHKPRLKVVADLTDLESIEYK